MAKRQDRDFWMEPIRPWAEDAVYHVDGFFAARVGDDLAGRFREVLERDASVWVKGVLPELRSACWWIRNSRWSGRPVVTEDLARVFECLDLAHMAGLRSRDVQSLLHCLMARCVCDNCDLSNGRRFS